MDYVVWIVLFIVVIVLWIGYDGYKNTGKWWG